jgi:ABC-type nitrate/sulfonate/bicarbonate transport system permease component
MLKKLITPLEKLKAPFNLYIIAFWVVLVLAVWFITTSGQKHLIPSPGQVMSGLRDLFNEGLISHIGSSLALCFQSVFYSIIVSLLLVYLSPLPLLKPLASLISKFRYLPLTGITFYFTVFFETARHMQIAVLVVFMSTFFITSLLTVIKDIPNEEFDHARTLKCSRWETLWEVIIKGRLDYVFDVLRQNLAIVWMMLVTIESILVASGGLGVLIKNNDKFMNHGKIFALQLVILALGLIIDVFLNFCRKSLFRYSKF